MKAEILKVPLKIKIPDAKIDSFCVESVAPIFQKEINTSHLHLIEKIAVLVLRPRKCIIDNRRLSTLK